MKMFSQNELLLMIGVVGILLLVISFLTVLDIVDYLKNKKKKDVVEENHEVEEEKEIIPKKLETVEVFEVNDNDEVLLSDVETDVKDEIVMPAFEEPILMEELPEVKESIVEPIIQEESVELEPVKKVEVQKSEIGNIEEEFNKALATPNEYDAIQKFEEEQERIAIISLDELLKKSDELYNSNEIVQYDDGNEPITIDEVINRFKEENKTVPEVMQDIVEEKPIYTHKESIPFISSVYGIEKSDNGLEFENTATYEKLSRSQTSDFMTKLREINQNRSE